MSTLVIADLRQVEELSSAHMRQFDGGVSCIYEAQVQGFYLQLAETYWNIGANAAGNTMQAKGTAVGDTPCTL